MRTTQKLSKSTKKEETEFLQSCIQSKKLEDSGEFEAAAEALGGLWKGIGKRPPVDELPDLIKAEVLVRTGILSGWLGSSRQTEGAQEKAKDLISEGIRIFEANQDLESTARAQSDLGICYWREGSFAEAEVYFYDALGRTSEENPSLRGEILLRLVNVAISNRNYSKADSLLNEAGPLIENYGTDLLKGKLYFHRALVFKLYLEEENNPEFVKKATENYKKASHFYGRADHKIYQAVVQSNLGFLFNSVKDYKNAHKHLDEALKMLRIIEDSGRLAITYDAKARVFLEQNKLIEAELFARQSVELLSGGDEYALLAESLTTLGIIMARLESFDTAAAMFDRAVESANFVSDSTSAGLAMLAQIEELQTILPDEERKAVFHKLEKLLFSENHPSIKNRIKKAAEILGKYSPATDWDTFSLTEEVQKFEAKYIRKALNETQGKITKAAELLSISHQNLSLMLKKRHKDLAAIKKPRKLRSDRKKVKGKK